MSKQQPPKGTVLCTPDARPDTYALLFHDLSEIRSPSISLIAQELSHLGIQTLVCALHHMQQPIKQKAVQECYEWLATHWHKPQIAIGIGLGAHIQHLIDWQGCKVMVHVDAPGEKQFASATNQDLFNSPDVQTPSGVVQIHVDTASSIMELSHHQPKRLAAIPQLWVGKPDQLASINPDSGASCIHIESTLCESEQKKNANVMAISRLIGAWILAQIALPKQNEEASNNRHRRFLQAEGYMFDSEQIEMRAGEDISFAIPATQETSERVLLLAMAHATLIQLRGIIKHNGWNIPHIHVDIRSAELHSLDKLDEEITEGTIGFIREIHVVKGMDEVRKNLLHHQLPNVIELMGLRIGLVNRLR